MGIMKEISVKALAKINLGLDVVRRREDGYHEVKMVMQTIHLFDRLEMKKTAGGITMTTNLSFLPTNENNLVYKAAKLLMDEFQIRDGIDVKLHKYIPVAAGMAGGSTDAAAVLYGMNRMFELGLSKEELMQRGVKIGADVPYCILLFPVGWSGHRRYHDVLVVVLRKIFGWKCGICHDWHSHSTCSYRRISCGWIYGYDGCVPFLPAEREKT